MVGNVANVTSAGAGDAAEADAAAAHTIVTQASPTTQKQPVER
jgi:hypothetical protein